MNKHGIFRDWLRHQYAHLWRLPRMHRSYGAMSLADTFTKIYRTKEWGDNGKPFFSGEGSHGPVIDEYCASVIQFIRDRQIRTVVDLGCGDFTVGRKIGKDTGIFYTGVDVVPELIEHHKTTVHEPNFNFLCADVTRDPLPAGDLCLIRQVFQHLSNEEIASILARLGSYPFILVSEEVPIHGGQFNRDKPHGPDVRGFYGSGVYVEQPPFSIPARELWRIPLTPYSLLRTVLIEQGSVR
jgi:SAM-dependent methyltransferase